LAGISFADSNLTDVAFFGCQLNGASFIGANLIGAQFIGCYAGAYGDPVLFGADRPAVKLVHSHIEYADNFGVFGSRWPAVVAAAAWQAKNGDNVERYQAVGKFAASRYKPIGPFLAGMLGDPEWDVRASVVQALTILRNGGFPDGDEAIVRAVVEALGDENSIVSMHATDFIRAVNPPSDLLTQVIQSVNADDPDSIVNALRIVIALSRADDPKGAVAATFDGRSLLHLLQSPLANVRTEYLHALGAANQNVVEAWETGLRDELPEVRAGALSAIRLLDDTPPARMAEPLLNDPAERVRIEALLTLGHLGGYDRALVFVALADVSKEVRRYAAMLLEADV
jgi:hypothetical protein